MARIAPLLAARRLFDAIARGDVERVRRLLERGVSPDSRLRGGKTTALMWATALPRNQGVAVARLLLRAGADPTARDGDGHTPLIAVRSAALTRLLLRAGAEADAVNNNDESALSYACVWGWTATAAALVEGGADPSHQFADGNTPMSFAAQSGARAVAEMLLRHGAEASPFALRCAIHGRHYRLAEIIAAHVDDFEERDCDGKTALDLAIEAGGRAAGLARLLTRLQAKPRLRRDPGAVARDGRQVSKRSRR